MGYDIHLTRADDWHANEGKEISDSEWLGVVAEEPDLQPDPANGRYSVNWTAVDGAWFDWYRGNVFTTNPDRAVLEKALQLAERLNATVQGDDGRVYQAAEDWEALPQPS